jgi:heat shock protein HtpX
MVGVFVLLGALYAGLLVAVSQFFEGYLVAAVVAVGAVSLVQLRYGETIALRTTGARVVDEREYPDLHARVDRLARSADIPKPRVAVADSGMPNAFAAGRSREHSVVAVTRGLLEDLDGDELDAVLAHELAHVKNRDAVVMTVASALSAMAFWIVRWGWLFDGDGGGENGQPHYLVAFAVALVVWVASFFVIRLLSRYREFAADRGAVAITGQPNALASALLSINGQMDDVPEKDLREHAGTSHLFFHGVEARLGKWFRTHPAVEKRVERLRDLEVEFESAGR